MKYPYHVFCSNKKEEYHYMFWAESEEEVLNRSIFKNFIANGYEILLDKMRESRPLVFMSHNHVIQEMDYDKQQTREVARIIKN